MTVIAAFSVGEHPIVFGDLLITGPSESADRPVGVPAMREAQDFFEGSGWAIKGLSQKVTLISNECVLAWAGSWLGARSAISSLRELAQTTPLSYENIGECLKGNADLGQHSVSLVGWIRQEDGIQNFGWNAEKFESPTLSSMMLAGSGSFALKEYSKLADGSDFASNSPDTSFHAVGRALMLGGMLLQSEYRGGYSAPTLRNMFGGGYQIALHHEGRVKRVNELTYVFWDAMLKGRKLGLTMPQFLVKQKYLGDYLFLRSCRVENQDGHNPEVVDEQRFVVPPMYDAVPQIDHAGVSAISYQSPMYVHCLPVFAPNHLGIYTRVVQQGSSGEPTMRFEDKEEGRIVVGFRRDIMEELFSDLNKAVHQGEKRTHDERRKASPAKRKLKPKRGGKKGKGAKQTRRKR
ncbi:MAG: hypothetical protein HY067_13715 [Betaproteobacteria bacterium]|nr:hypothetical protein [Betaproteobacteria bacterium]